MKCTFDIHGLEENNMANGRGLYNILKKSEYPAIDELLYAICDRFDNELCTLADNVRSEKYSVDEIVEQISEIRKMIKRDI